MMAEQSKRPSQTSARRILLAWGVASGILGIIGWFDFLTGYDAQFFALYFIPVTIVAWRIGLGSGIAMSCLCATVWLMADAASGHPYARPLTPYWNTGMELVACLGMATAIAILRRKFEMQKKLNSRLEDALNKVNRLRKNLLNDGGMTARLFNHLPRY